MFNIHECEGRRDGAARDVIAIICRFQAVKFWRERKAALTVVQEENYQIYKAAFLKAFFAK